MKCYLGNKIKFLFFSLILISGLCLRLSWAGLKDGMHCDEVASFSISECEGAYFHPFVFVNPNTEMSGREIKELYFIHDSSLKGALRDVRSMWHNVYDYNHTNFYYSILRLFFVGAKSTHVSDVIFRGVLLNLLIFVLSYFVFFKLLLLYFSQRPLLLFMTLACFSFMAGGVSNTLFIRPYELQMFVVLVLSYWLSKVFISLANDSWQYNSRNFLITTVLLALTLWTGYFMLVLVGAWGVFLLWEIYRKGQFAKGLPFFFSTFVCALLLCRILYLSYFLGFGGDQRISSKFLADGVVERVLASLVVWAQLIGQKTLYWPVAVFVLVLLFIGRKRIAEMPKIVLPTVLFTLAVMILSPYQTNRYMVAVTPLLLLVIPVAVDCLKNRAARNTAVIFIVSLYMIMPLFERNIDYLFRKSDLLDMLANETGRIHLVQDQRWKISTLISYLEDDIVYDLSDSIEKCDLKPDDVIVYAGSQDGFSQACQFDGEYKYHKFYKVK